jgi:hypothetical protein
VLEGLEDKILEQLPCAGITRIRFNGYDLSPKSRGTPKSCIVMNSKMNHRFNIFLLLRNAQGGDILSLRRHYPDQVQWV